MKKNKKILINVIVIFIIVFNLFIPNVYADNPLEDIMNKANELLAMVKMEEML